MRAGMHTSALSRGGGRGLDMRRACQHQPGPTHIRTNPELWCTQAIWHNYLYYHSISILGNLLQTVSPQNLLNYILGSTKAQKTQSGMDESDLVKEKVASASAWGFGTDSQGMVIQEQGRDTSPPGPYGGFWSRDHQRVRPSSKLLLKGGPLPLPSFKWWTVTHIQKVHRTLYLLLNNYKANAQVLGWHLHREMKYRQHSEAPHMYLPNHSLSPLDFYSIYFLFFQFYQLSLHPSRT